MTIKESLLAVKILLGSLRSYIPIMSPQNNPLTVILLTLKTQAIQQALHIA